MHSAPRGRRSAPGQASRIAGLVSSLCLWLAGAAALAAPAPSQAQERGPRDASARATLRVRLDARARRVAGVMDVVVQNPGPRPLYRVYLWLLPNRMQEPPAALDDVNHYWIYPRAFNPGAMELTAVRAGPPGRVVAVAGAPTEEPHAVAGPGALVSVALPEPVAQGQEIALSVDFSARIPERYGGLGCIGGRCTLIGGFHPMLAALDQAGWDLEAPPMDARWDVSLELAQPASVVLFDQIFGQAPAAAPVTHARATFARAPYVPLIVAPRLHLSERRRGDVTVRYLATHAPPPTDVAHEQILPYTEENHARYALESALDSLALLDAIGAPTRASQILMVEAPLRFDLAQAYPGGVAVSDRFYRIWPAKRFRKFHQRQLVRALYGHLMGRLMAERGQESARDLDAAADLVASYLTDLFVLGQYKKNEFMGDILHPVAFIPVVDQLLYAPQTMFAGAYFGDVLDDEPLRDHPSRFMHQRPRGKLLYEKLRDLLQPEALRAALRAVIVDGAPVRSAAEAAYGAPLDWFFRQWEEPYPRLDYRLAGTASTPLPGGGYDHEIRVERRTAATEQPPLEPVTVLVVLRGGGRRIVRWDGRGSTGVLHLRAREPIDHVVVDPARRLVERGLPGESENPLFDNRDAHQTRFVYNSFGVILNITDLSALLAADFSLGRVHDIRHRSRFTLYTSASTVFGATVRYTRGFGPQVTPDRLLGGVSSRISAQRLRSGFFGDTERAGSRLSAGLRLGEDGQQFLFEPRFGRSLGVGGSVSVTRFDAAESAGGSVPAEYSVSGSVSADYVILHTLGGGHTFAAELSATAVLGQIASRSQLLAAGGPSGLRGYAPGALFGRSLLMARAEYRHVYTHQLNWNLGHYNFVRAIGGALFVDAAALSPCASLDLAAKDSLYASVGYGVRFFYDSFGTLPQLMRVDVAVPLVASSRDCLGEPPDGGPPVMVYLGFLPPF